MNQARTHSSSELAFRQHADYACALTIHLSPYSRFIRWLRFRAEQAKPARALREVSKQR